LPISYLSFFKETSLLLFSLEHFEPEFSLTISNSIWRSSRYLCSRAPWHEEAMLAYIYTPSISPAPHKESYRIQTGSTSS